MNPLIVEYVEKSFSLSQFINCKIWLPFTRTLFSHTFIHARNFYNDFSMELCIMYYVILDSTQVASLDTKDGEIY